MARIVGGFGISHSPTMGFEYDKGMKAGFDPRWQVWFDGTRPLRRWLAELQPDILLVVYNDHLNHFTFDAYPTFALGVADEFPQADEGWGKRDFPSLPGDARFGWHVARSLVAHDFDPTICQELPVDHGMYSWLPYLLPVPWPVRIVPIEVNVLRQPLPRSDRLVQLGRVLREAVLTDPSDARVCVVATGGMSHQISGARFGMVNEEWDRHFLVRLERHLDELVRIPQDEIMAVGGADAVELIMWYAMRAALSDDIREVYSFYAAPQHVGCGIVAYEEPG